MKISCCKNLIKRINSWVVHFVIYSGLFLKWTREKLRQMDRKTRKLIMHKALHLRIDKDRLHVSSIDDYTDASTQGIEDCI